MMINTNIPALTAFNALTQNTKSLQKAIQQVSTGLRINSAADDAAGLAISETLRSQSAGLQRAMMNAQDGISLIQTAEGALGETNTMLQRMRELAVQAANDTLTSQDRSYLQMEIDELKKNIDDIAGNTQFNTKSLLDGSLCGTWSSSDPKTKAYLRGNIKAEGNYRIEVKANPGAAQVQKSNIFRIKHENVATDVQMNADNGVGGVEIDGMPAGYYNITATKATGEGLALTYDSLLTGTVTEGNGSGFPETMELTFTDSEGETGTFTVSLAATDTTPQLTAAAIAGQLNGQSITIGENSYTLTAEDNGNGTYTVSSTGNASGIKSITSATPVVDVSVTTALTANASSQATDTMYVTTSSGTIRGSLDESTNVTFTFTNRAGQTGTKTVTIPAGSASDIATSLKSALNGTTVEIDGTNEVIQCTASGANFNIVTSTDDETRRINSITTNQSDIIGSISSRYTETSSTRKSTISGTVTSSNSNSINEKITLTFHDKRGGTQNRDPDTGEAYTSSTIGAIYSSNSSGGYWYKYIRNDTIEIEVEPGLTESEIAAKIQEAVEAKGSLTFASGTFSDKFSDTIDITGTTSGASYTIKTGTYSSTGSDIGIVCNVTLSATPSGATTASSNSGYPAEVSTTVRSATTNLTGFYGSEDAEASLSAAVNINTQNNASILFEVVGSAFDDTLGTGTITLQASSHVLNVDGTTENRTKSRIVISTSDTTPVDISELLGEDPGALTLTLDPSKFNYGDKFVYNVSGNGTSSIPSDTSLHINGSQDSTWPYSWGTDGYITHKNNPLYYNVNADAVSNKELRFRNYYLNSEDGTVHDGEIRITANEDFGTKAAGFPDPSSTDSTAIGSFTANYVGKIAGGTTKLRDLEQFWNTHTGVFMLESPQTITVSQHDGRSAAITLTAMDTLNDLRDKLNKAIAEDLGQGVYTSGSNANNFVTFVETPDTSGMESVKGTMLVRSVIPGKAGELTFSSINGALIDALGLNTVQGSQETSYTASVYNAHNGTVIARGVSTSGNILQGVIDENIDVEFDAMSGVKAVWSDKDKNFILTPEQDICETYLHIVKNNIAFQTGANTGEDIALDIGDMSSGGLGIQGVNLMTRERASEAITVLDAAIRNVSSQRTKLGSYQNELERTIETLTVGSTGLTAAESRIRDADMSKSMMDLVKYQIIHQSGTAVLGQANQLPQSVLSLVQ
ncbi:MAG: hypothetical protein IJS39_13980 [Synergistaceae bacterium]|nr:hypothetical protein [Synergistaceae bacterium]